eukprot:TRINITY_DN67660_c9_g7_i1.p1 TRINITY_DN67660_c9_g7~~TRINITY_DN67660_c9_g7_i1.p1  ORF type:complete len:1594 (+),score=981.30 TRINITY_DN67660_c9_g7_i1:137-4918(+)
MSDVSVEDIVALLQHRDTKKVMSGVAMLEEYVEEESLATANQRTARDLLDGLGKVVGHGNHKVALSALRSLCVVVDQLQLRVKNHMNELLDALVERLGDRKQAIRETSIKVILKLMNALGVSVVFQRLRMSVTHRNHMVRENILGVFIHVIDMFGADVLPFASFLPDAVKLFSDPNSEVREMALASLMLMYKYVGKDMIKYIKKKQSLSDRNRATILEHFSDVTVVPSSQRVSLRSKSRAGSPRSTLKRPKSGTIRSRTPGVSPRLAGLSQPKRSAGSGAGSDESSREDSYVSSSSASSSRRGTLKKKKSRKKSLKKKKSGGRPGTAQPRLKYSSSRNDDSGGSGNSLTSRPRADSLASQDSNSSLGSVGGGRLSSTSTTSSRIGTLRKKSSSRIGSASPGANAGADVQELFLSPDIKPIVVYSERELEKEIKAIGESLKDSRSTQWKSRIVALQRLAGLVRGGAAELDNFLPLLRSIKDPIASQAEELRSIVAREACTVISFLSRVLKDDFTRMADFIVPVLFKLTFVTIQVINESGNATIRTILQNTRIKRAMRKILEGTAVRNNVLRARCVEYLLLLLEVRKRSYLETWADEIQEHIGKCVTDKSGDVRATARQCFWAFHAHWKSRADQLFDSLDSTTQRNLADDEAAYKILSEQRRQAYARSAEAPDVAASPAKSSIPKLRPGSSSSSRKKKKATKRPGSASRRTKSAATLSKSKTMSAMNRPKTAALSRRTDSFDSTSSLSSSGIPQFSDTPPRRLGGSNSSSRRASGSSRIRGAPLRSASDDTLTTGDGGDNDDDNDSTSGKANGRTKRNKTLKRSAKSKSKTMLRSGASRVAQSRSSRSSAKSSTRSSPKASPKTAAAAAASSTGYIDSDGLDVEAIARDASDPNQAMVAQLILDGRSPSSDTRSGAMDSMRELLERAANDDADDAASDRAGFVALLRPALELIREGMLDPNQNACRAALEVVPALVVCCKEEVEKSLSLLIPNVFLRLADSNSTLREAANNILLRLNDVYGAESLYEPLLKVVTLKNPRVKVGALEFLHHLMSQHDPTSDDDGVHQGYFSQSTSNVRALTQLVYPLALATHNPRLRDMAINVLVQLIDNHNKRAFCKVVLDLPPDTVERLTEALDTMYPYLQDDLDKVRNGESLDGDEEDEANNDDQQQEQAASSNNDNNNNNNNNNIEVPPSSPPRVSDLDVLGAASSDEEEDDDDAPSANASNGGPSALSSTPKDMGPVRRPGPLSTPVRSINAAREMGMEDEDEDESQGQANGAGGADQYDIGSIKDNNAADNANNNNNNNGNNNSSSSSSAAGGVTRGRSSQASSSFGEEPNSPLSMSVSMSASVSTLDLSEGNEEKIKQQMESIAVDLGDTVNGDVRVRAVRKVGVITKSKKQRQVLRKHFDVLFVPLLDVMEDPRQQVREAALSVVHDVLSVCPDQFTDFTYAELVIINLLEVYRSWPKEAHSTANKAMAYVTKNVQPVDVVGVLVSSIESDLGSEQADSLNVLHSSLRMLTKLIERMEPDALRSVIERIAPVLCSTMNHKNPMIRKDVVSCFVAMHGKVGDELDAHTASLNPTQLRLVKIYISRASSK